MSNYVIRKFNGDDAFSWAVFRREAVNTIKGIVELGQARPIISGLNREMAEFYKRKYNGKSKEIFSSRNNCTK